MMPSTATPQRAAQRRRSSLSLSLSLPAATGSPGGGGAASAMAPRLPALAGESKRQRRAMGDGAGLGFTHDAKRYFDGVEFGGTGGSPEDDRHQRDVDRFFDLASASAGLMLAAAACMALRIILSVYSLVKSQ